MKSATKNIFERKEKKYVITEEQMEMFLDLIADNVEHDQFFDSRIMSTYYDMPDYSIIEHSLSKPKFKEKLRVRSYGTDTLFVELKKKYNGIVYKRRVEMTEQAARAWMSGDAFDAAVSKYGMPFKQTPSYLDLQIAREIEVYRLRHSGLSPAMNIYAHRFSYIEKGNEYGARITFDTELRYKDLRSANAIEVPVRLTNMIVMEVKVHNAYPLWLVNALSKLEMYPTSFSKYGTAYKELKGEFCETAVQSEFVNAGRMA